MATTIESRQNPPSVLASLMGLDEILLHQPVKKRKPQRVLSENYLQKVASIGVWEQRSFNKQRSLKVGIEKKKQQKRSDEGNSKSCQESEGSLKKELSRVLGPDQFYTFLEPRLGSKIQTCPFHDQTVVSKQKPEKAENALKCPLSNGSPSLKEIRKQNSGRWRMVKDFQVALADGDKAMGRTGVDVLSMSDCRSLSRNRSPNYKTLNLSSPVGISSGDGWRNVLVRNLPTSRSGSFASTESSKTRISNVCFYNRWFMNKNPRPSNNLAKLQSRKRSFNGKDGEEVRNSGFSCENSHPIPYLKSDSGHSAQDKSCIWDSMCNIKKISGQNATISKPSNHQIRHSSITHTGCDDLAACLDANVKNVFMYESPGKHNQKLVSSDCHLDAKADDSTSYIPQISSQQEDIAAEFSEESSVASYYSSVDHDSFGNFDMCHSSPVSVLEASFEGEISSFSEWFPDVNACLSDMKLQVGVLESGSLEASPEWSGVVVSGDDEAEEECIGDPKREELIRPFRVEESRDFSYMGDILTEAGFHGTIYDMDFGAWHSPDSPISPSVFDMLEKKYGDQTCWRRSERRLLFDRVNSALTEILQPWLGFPTWAKPTAGRLAVLQIEEALWKLLVNQEKETRMVSSSSSEKALGKDDGWLFLGNDNEVIAIEIENSLVEELVSDIVRSECC